MSILTDLINQIDDANLKERISKEVDKLAKQKSLVWFLKTINQNVRLFTKCQLRLVHMLRKRRSNKRCLYSNKD